jgi:AcrR family transcriptional regulator
MALMPLVDPGPVLPRGRSTYHHGDLPQTLQAAALAIVEERGIGAVTMAECARQAGVSAAAPYRHFANREALLAATAIRCYADWNARREEHPMDTAEPRRALDELIDDFFSLASEDPGAFSLIFDSGLQNGSPQLRDWSVDGLRQLVDVVARLTGAPRRACRTAALGIVATVLGHAKMSLDGFSGLTLAAAAEMSRAVIDHQLAGLAAEVVA